MKRGTFLAPSKYRYRNWIMTPRAASISKSISRKSSMRISRHQGRFIRALASSHRADESPVPTSRTRVHKWVFKTACNKNASEDFPFESCFLFGGDGSESAFSGGLFHGCLFEKEYARFLIDGVFSGPELGGGHDFTPFFLGPLCVIARCVGEVPGAKLDVVSCICSSQTQCLTAHRLLELMQVRGAEAREHRL